MITAIEQKTSILQTLYANEDDPKITYVNSTSTIVCIDRWLVLGPWRVTRIWSSNEAIPKSQQETENVQLGIEGRYGERTCFLALGNYVQFTLTSETCPEDSTTVKSSA